MTAHEIAGSLVRNVDWSWGDSTQRYAWWDRWNDLKRQAPLLAECIQMIRYRKYESWKDYERFCTDQRRLRREAKQRNHNIVAQKGVI